MRHMIAVFVGTGLALALTVGWPRRSGAAEAGAFRSAWPEEAERVWIGPEYWSNRLQDWRIAGGRLECVLSGADRNVHLLTRQLGGGKGNLKMSVRLGLLKRAKPRPSVGWAGFRIGAIGQWKDYRDSCRRGVGLDAGLTTAGRLFLGAPKRPAALARRGIPRKGWKVHHVSSEETRGENSRARSVFDGRPETIWHTRYKTDRARYPHEIQIDLGGDYEVCGFCYLPRQAQVVGRIADYAFHVSADGKDWGEPAGQGRFPNSAEMQEVRFAPRRGRYVRLVAKSGVLARPAAAVAELFVLDKATAAAKPKPPAPATADAVPLDDVELRAAAEPRGDAYRLTLTAHDPKTGRQLASVSRTVPAARLVGNLALVCHAGAGRRGERTGGNVRFWFRDWRVAGGKVEAHDERAFGPILWAQHTLSRGVLKMTAQMPPLGAKDSQTVGLEIRDKPAGAWREIATARIDRLARTATFRVPGWDSSRAVPYRVVYRLIGPDGKARPHTWSGTIRRDPVEKSPIVVAAFTGNADYGFPNNDVVKHVAIHDPDVLFFSGDNIYENVGGYGCQRSPLELACLEYLRKWYFFGWAFRELMRDRPCVSIPDDHDVFQGNLWGQGGRKTPRDHFGGYVMPAEWVKVVERTQTSNLPDPFDPTPIEQGLGVYYTAMTYGRVSFAILEDRKFKSGPAGLVPPTTSGRPDHVIDPKFDPKTADVPGAKLLGDRQLEFLRRWAADWRGADMKAALSQTVFCGVATLHGGGKRRLVVDYDSNGWPQTGRNKALHELRRGFAFMIGGDQHLATIVHHGIDTWDDAGWSLAVPSVANFYPRAWVPLKPGQPLGEDMPEHTGRFRDGLGNPMTVWAHTNPRPMGKQPASLHDKMPGYGVVRFHKDTRKITIECWPRFANPAEPKTGGQYEGWPKTIEQLDNYGRKAAAWLPTIEVTGLTDPVVQVIDEADGEVVYTLRVKGRSFRPKVFRAGTYTVKVGEGDTGKTKTLKNVRADKRPGRTLPVAF
jgi:alkaline phosphatase D